MIHRYAIVGPDSIVRNISAWDGVTPVSRPAGVVAVKLNPNEQCEKGATYVPSGTPRFVLPARRFSGNAYEFLQRFTKPERTKFRNRAKTDDAVADFEMLVTASAEISGDDPTVVEGMAALVTGNVISAARRDQILGA